MVLRTIFWQGLFLKKLYNSEFENKIWGDVKTEYRVTKFNKLEELSVLKKFYFLKNLLWNLFDFYFYKFSLSYFFIKKEGKKIKNLRKRRNIHFCLTFSKSFFLNAKKSADSFFEKIVCYSNLLSTLNKDYMLNTGIFMRRQKFTKKIEILIFNPQFLFDFVANKEELSTVNNDSVIKISLYFTNNAIANKYWSYLKSNGLSTLHNEKA